MLELAVIERFIFSSLQPSASELGWQVPQIAPFDTPEGGGSLIAVPVHYFRMVGTGDRNAVGPGPRILVWADYEIGVFHDSNSFGAALRSTGGTTPLLSALANIDALFQNYTPPVVVPDGVIYSIERQFAVRVPERNGGKLYRRDGGVYRFHVEAS